jgi:hypothetical protein
MMPSNCKGPCQLNKKVGDHSHLLVSENCSTDRQQSVKVNFHGQPVLVLPLFRILSVHLLSLTMNCKILVCFNVMFM